MKINNVGLTINQKQFLLYLSLTLESLYSYSLLLHKKSKVNGMDRASSLNNLLFLK